MTCKHVKWRNMRGMTWGNIWYLFLGRAKWQHVYDMRVMAYTNMRVMNCKHVKCREINQPTAPIMYYSNIIGYRRLRVYTVFTPRSVYSVSTVFLLKQACSVFNVEIVCYKQIHNLIQTQKLDDIHSIQLIKLLCRVVNAVSNSNKVIV